MKKTKINSLVLFSTFAFGFASSNAVCAAGNTNEGISLVELPANDGGNSITCLEEKTVMEQPASDNTLPVRSAEKTGTECTTADAGQPSKSSHLINHPAKIVGKNRKEQVKQSRGTGPVAGCFVASIAASSVGAVNSGLMNTIGKTPKQKPDDPKEEDNLKDQEIQKLKEELEQLRKRKEELEEQNENPTGKKTIVFASVIGIVILTGIIIWLCRRLKAERHAGDKLVDDIAEFLKVSDKNEVNINNLNKALSTFQEKFDDLQKNLQSKTDELTTAENVCSQLRIEKSALENKFKAQEKAITEHFNPKINELEGAKSQLETLLVSKDEEITQLNANIESMQKLIGELQSKAAAIDNLVGENEQLKNSLQQEKVNSKYYSDNYDEAHKIKVEYEKKFGSVDGVTVEEVQKCVTENTDLKRQLYYVYSEYKKVCAALAQLKNFVDVEKKRGVFTSTKIDIKGGDHQSPGFTGSRNERQKLFFALQSNAEKAVENSSAELSRIANQFSEEEKGNLNAQEDSNYGLPYQIQYKIS